MMGYRNGYEGKGMMEENEFKCHRNKGQLELSKSQSHGGIIIRKIKTFKRLKTKIMKRSWNMDGISVAVYPLLLIFFAQATGITGK